MEFSKKFSTQVKDKTDNSFKQYLIYHTKDKNISKYNTHIYRNHENKGNVSQPMCLAYSISKYHYTSLKRYAQKQP